MSEKLSFLNLGHNWPLEFTVRFIVKLGFIQSLKQLWMRSMT